MKKSDATEVKIAKQRLLLFGSRWLLTDVAVDGKDGKRRRWSGESESEP